MRPIGADRIGMAIGAVPNPLLPRPGLVKSAGEAVLAAIESSLSQAWRGGRGKFHMGSLCLFFVCFFGYLALLLSQHHLINPDIIPRLTVISFVAQFRTHPCL